jgi:DNA-binding MarR family transcriptional regulator
VSRHRTVPKNHRIERSVRLAPDGANPEFVLTNSHGMQYLAAMTVEQTIRVVQMAFPQVYLACHTRHERKRSTEDRLSQRDSAILAHLDEQSPTVPSRLARHMGIARSTLSEALKRLVVLGYVEGTSTGKSSSARLTGATLTARGARAIRNTSVLETKRLHRALADLNAQDLKVIAAGMARLAAACREFAGEDKVREA